MALPVLNAPTYELTIPSTKKKVKYRPFLVKEEKALLIAQQSEDENVMLNTLKSVINVCMFEKVNVDNLAIFDIEYIFCQMRAKSVSEFAEVIYNCLNCNDEKGKVKIPVDLSSIEVEFSKKHTSDIHLFDKVGVKMKYPTLSLMKKINEANSLDIDIIFDIVIDSIESIYTEDEVFVTKDQDREEVENFINNLTKEQFQKIEQFFETMPKFYKTIEWDCPNCKFHHKTVLQGIESFF